MFVTHMKPILFASVFGLKKKRFSLIEEQLEEVLK